MLRLTPAGIVALALCVTPALAEPLTGKEAKKLVFAPIVAEVEVMAEAGLPADQAEVLKTVGVSQPYYGAIAIAPDEGLMSEATVAAAVKFCATTRLVSLTFTEVAGVTDMLLVLTVPLTAEPATETVPAANWSFPATLRFHFVNWSIWVWLGPRGLVYDGEDHGRLVDRFTMAPNRFVELPATAASKRATAVEPPEGFPPAELAADTILTALARTRLTAQAFTVTELRPNAVRFVAGKLGVRSEAELDERIEAHDRARASFQGFMAIVEPLARRAAGSEG